MKQTIREALPAAIEHVRPKRFAVLASDGKGNLLRLLAPALMKGQRYVTYSALGPLPPAVLREVGKANPGLVVRELTEGERPEGADLAFTDSLERLALCWHSRAVVLSAPSAPAGYVVLHTAKGEPPLWSYPALALPPPRFEVRTRNCIPEAEIRKNLLHSFSLGLPSVQRCTTHGRRALMCSGGPSLVNYLDEIDAEHKRDGAPIVCVKHSHDVLLAAGIVPWACVLLDPRGHVRDFIPEPDPRVLYMVSSTCHPSTFDRLLAAGARVELYHPLVGAGEDDMASLFYGTVKPPNHLAGRWAPPQMIPGGTTSASRGLMVLYMLLGFRHFVLWGYDSCFWDRKDMNERKPDGQPRWHELTHGKQKFTTDAELYAQVQDFEWMLGQLRDVRWDARGEGMVPALMRGRASPPALEALYPELAREAA